ncbi:MAG: hypothetical protein V2B14_04645 [bacterium]
MDIKQIKDKNNSAKDNFAKLIDNSDKMGGFSPRYELAGFCAFEELLQSAEQPEIKTEIKSVQANSNKIINNPETEIKSTKNSENLNIKNIKNLEIFMQNENLLKLNNKFKLDLSSLDKDDLDFLIQCLNSPDMTLNSLNFSDFQMNFLIPGQTDQVSYRSFNLSKSLFNLIEYSYTSQKPMRIDFDKGSSVILKINAEGKLSAEFLSSNKNMEQALKNSIPYLINKFDTEGIPYKDIIYKDDYKKRNKKKNKGD